MNSPEFDLAPNLTGDDELWTDAEKRNDAICVFIDGVYGHFCRFSVQAHSVTFTGTNCIWPAPLEAISTKTAAANGIH